jgi:hypothetical protein
LFHSKGGIEYTQPLIKAEYKPDEFRAFSNEFGFDCISPKHHDGYKMHVKLLEAEQRIELARIFAERYGMIKQEYDWKNKEGMQKLVDIINLR